MHVLKKREEMRVNTLSESWYYLVYTRISVAKRIQNQEFSTLENQRAYCEAYMRGLSENKGIQLGYYEDRGVSGTTMNRPGWNGLIGDILNGKIRARAGLSKDTPLMLVAHDLNRFARSIEFKQYDKIFKEHNVILYSVQMGKMDISSSANRFSRDMYILVSSFTAEQASERVAERVQRAKELGLHTGGPPSLGYNLIKGKLIIHEQEASFIRYLFQRFLAIKSITALLEEVNHAGHRTKVHVTQEGKTIGGKPFTKIRLYYLLQNPLYIGYVRHYGVRHKGQHLPIITEACFEAVQSLFREAPIKRKRYSGKPALLTGLLYCEPCNAAMYSTYTVKHKKKGMAISYFYYLCGNHARKKQCPSPNPTLPAYEVEQCILKEIHKLLKSPEVVIEYLKQCKEASIPSEVAFGKMHTIQDTWHAIAFFEQKRIVELLVKRAEIRNGNLDIHFDPHGLESFARKLEQNKGYSV